MISVCMATYNGQKYIKEQIDSILPQLSENDELVISDDQSTDGTTEIIASYKDPRIRLFVNNKTHGVAHNFENALAHAKGDIIFLSDQDDVWVEGKVEKMTSYMKQNHYDVVMCNCMLVDENMKPLTGKPHFNKVRPIKKPVFLNILKNSWLGCCMVFSKKLLTECLPFPPNVAAHDLWIALYAQLHFRCGYMPNEVLHLYRRHSETASFAGKRSTNKWSYRISYRLYLAYHLIARTFNRNKHKS